MSVFYIPPLSYYLDGLGNSVPHNIAVVEGKASQIDNNELSKANYTKTSQANGR